MGVRLDGPKIERRPDVEESIISEGLLSGSIQVPGDGKPIIILTEDKNAVRRPRKTTGLFHVAIRVPSRKELALLLRRLSQERYSFEGFADHGVSEALYGTDPEGNGIEFYVDRPRSAWTFVDGKLRMGTSQLDLRVVALWKSDR
jgi:catechol 2,3-dioxygenase